MSSCCSPDGHCHTNADGAPQAIGISTVYAVTGMTCGHCEKAVNSALSALEGVTGVTVDVSAGLATVISGSELDDERVRDAIDEAGYELAGRAAAPATH
ncbi:heavy-metal-associated domain-containing protein [Actinacidiphila glaucinigra]|uniref:heavy-metal-associated domain-containing protein n=1 Tax=Actinacidiphila glaucinigra TaxID=235986 RepID=UPI0037191F72